MSSFERDWMAELRMSVVTGYFFEHNLQPHRATF
jgi:hypothetical protein